MTQGGKGGGPTRLGGSGSDPGPSASSSFPSTPSAGSSADLARDTGAGSSASMSMAEHDASMVGEVLDGRYKIVKKLGEGGMGEVYAAEHVHIAKKVAIKLLRKEVVSNAEAVSRFRQEARSASTIGHRNIIGIDDFGQLADGRIYLCMEYLDGAPLNDMITEQLPAERLLNILIQTGHGLAAAHAKGIIHRDMKPENIFVTVTPQGEDIPKILDFGIAKVGGQDGGNNLTKTGTIFGTPYYMAPEQALGQNVDARVDIYALGVILYEVFAGSLPFSGESFMGVLTQHITTEPEPVAQRAAKAGRVLPAGLAEVIARAMAKDPDRRYRTMDEMVNALVAVYRGVAGAGMSSYLEAQPRASASQPNVPRPGAPTAGAGSGMLGTMPATPAAGGAASAASSAGMPPTVVAGTSPLAARPPASAPMGVPPGSGPM
ncbi:MAG TPA: protein kinase, partial [Kofleriaceae bacterium]|nr:protein kinase [Kofleriaceae bacterium]